nr:hypothetical protein [Candidatus Woesebacteria bacterium]
EKIEQIITQSNAKSPSELAKSSKAIHRLIVHGEFPPELVSQILPMYLKIGEGRVFLSPSVHLSDSNSPLVGTIDHSFFGYDGEANVFEGIKEVWSHFFDPKPLFYRLKHQTPHFQLPFAVCIQRHPKFVTTGILYTSDPTASEKNTCLVKAVLGEQGLIEEVNGADYYWISKSSKEELKTVIDKQTESIMWEHGESVFKKITGPAQQRRKLPTAAIGQLGKLATKVQQHFFFPQKVVFGFDGKSIWVVDVSPLDLPAQTLHTTSHPSSVVQATTQTPATAKPQQPAQSHVQPAIGILHPLTPDARLPAMQPTGHLYLQPALLLEAMSAGKAVTNRLVAHELQKTLTFLCTKSHAPKGFFYEIDTHNPELVASQLQALALIKTQFSTLHFGLVFAHVEHCAAYAQIVRRVLETGLVRASMLTHYLLLSVPSQLYEIEPCVQKGLDGVVIDVDEIARHLYAKNELSAADFSSPAVIEYVRSAAAICHQEGILCYIKSIHSPTQEMLEIFNISDLAEWIGTPQAGHYIKDRQ